MSAKKPARSPRPPPAPLPARWSPTADAADIAVPGLDASWPVADQIAYIENLKTRTLMSIDAHITGARNLMTARLLPQFQRFAQAAQPVRAAAEQYTKLFEMAARTSFVDGDDTQAADETQLADETIRDAPPPAQPHSQPPTPFDPDRTPSESSFLPGANAISSTPAAATRARMAADSTFASDASSSAESPLVRLSRDLRAFAAEDAALGPLAPPAFLRGRAMPGEAGAAGTPSFLRGRTGAGPGDADAESSADAGSEATDSLIDSSADGERTLNASLRLRERARSRSRSKSLGRAREPSLRETVLRQTQRDPATPRAHAYAPPPAEDDDDDADADASFDDAAEQSFLRDLRARYGGPPSAASSSLSSISAPVLAASPAKTAVARMRDALLRASPGTTASSASSGAIARWDASRDATGTSAGASGDDATLESLLRQVQRLGAPSSASAPVNPGYDEEEDSFEFGGGDESSAPSAAFELAAAGGSVGGGGDSDEEDSFDLGGGGGGVGAMYMGGGDDDSFDVGPGLGGADGVDGETVEETVFGMPPAQRAARASMGAGLRMYGGGFEEDSVGGPESSPTPYGSGAYGGEFTP